MVETFNKEPPLSFQQESMLKALGASPYPDVYNLLWSLRFRDPLDPALLRTALNTTIRAHDALRATFDPRHDRSAQRIVSPQDTDLGPWKPDEVSEQDLHAFAVAFGQKPFDLTNGPLFRFRLLRTDAKDHVLLCAFHHLVIDGHSWGLFVAELTDRLAGVEVARLSVQYPDYSHWQRDQQASGAWIHSAEHWRNVYGAIGPSWDLPSDRPRPALVESTAGCHSVDLPESLTTLFRKFHAAYGLTPFRTGFAILALLLHKMTGRSDLMLVTTLIGRSDKAFSRLLGFFVNQAGIDVTVDEAAGFTTLAAQLSARLDAAVAHQEYPYDLALRESGRRWKPGRDPLSPVSFTKLPASRPRMIGDLSITEERIFLGHAGHDLALYFQDRGDTFRMEWIYRTALFDHETIVALAGRYEHMLQQALERPLVPVGTLPVATPAELMRILSEWNATDHAFPGPHVIHQLVEAQVKRTPDRVAVVTRGRILTYHELNTTANRLARIMQKRGIGRGCFVPILMEPGVDLIVAELAVMKCGAAFVPLNPAWPKRRLDLLLRKTGSAMVLVADAGDRASINPPIEALVIDLSARSENELDLMVPVDRDDPIYCLFTSGSSGEPKGAINRHAGIANRFSVMTRRFGARDDEVVLATTPPYYDSSVWQYFWPLTRGGRTVILPTASAINPGTLPDLVETHGITFTDFVPSILELLVSQLAERPDLWPKFRTLRHALVGGEAMVSGPIYRFKAMFPHAGLTNSYGPTETSIGIIFHEVPPEFTPVVPIGRPIENVRAVILDRWLMPVPPGLTGELYVGGVCMGLGYLGEEEATARVFIKNPFPELQCSMLYRTGDLARFTRDGVIEYLGRADDQLKINGVRIEPGEIEHVLLAHPRVRQVVVAVPEAEPRRLTAFISAVTPDISMDAADIRSFLSERLPAALVPEVYVLVDELPVTQSGKMDRKAVMQLRGQTLQVSTPHTPPRNERERHLCELWARLLKIPTPGIDDDFFELGGDSLQAIRLAACLLEKYGLELPLGQFYAKPTVRGLAALSLPQGGASDVKNNATETDVLARQRLFLRQWPGSRDTENSFLFTLNAGGTKTRLFWCFQGANEFELLAAHLGSDQPVTGMRSGHEIMTYTPGNVSALAEQYANEMKRLQPEGAFIIGGNCQGGIIARAVTERLLHSGREVALLILMEQQTHTRHNGRVALIFGRESRFNPFRNGTRDPEGLFRRTYPGGFGVRLVDGEHGQFFDRKNIASLAGAISACLATPSNGAIPATSFLETF